VSTKVSKFPSVRFQNVGWAVLICDVGRYDVAFLQVLIATRTEI
jgi:hypothetical protein